MKRALLISSAFVLTLGAFSTNSEAQCTPTGPPVCPDFGQAVICENGVVYRNQCWASKDCFEDCQPWGGSPYGG